LAHGQFFHPPRAGRSTRSKEHSMLHTTKNLRDYAIGATDGPIGDIDDFYFDDKDWVIRYLVVDTGSWLSSRKVLVSPMAIGQPDHAGKVLPANISKAQVRDSPDIDTERPVSRQQESEFLGYYGHPYYWGTVGLWGAGAYPNAVLPGAEGFGSPSAARAEADNAYARAEPAADRDEDPHLRSCAAVTGYNIAAIDGEIGHVQGFLVDEESWAIRYLIVNTSNWWLGHEVLIAPQWIESVNWSDKTVSVDMTRRSVQDAPPHDPALAPDHQQESAIHAHHGSLVRRHAGLKGS